MQKVGILGGGQLGRMLLQVAANYPVETYVMENDTQCPSAHLCHHFILGDIRNYNDVYSFGKQLNAITIEIENVNIEALEQLEQEGVKIFPKPAVLKIIKNKISQKEYYAQHQIPTPAYIVTQNKAELMNHSSFLPAVHKIGEGGYDGRGVQVIRNREELEKGFDAPAVLEKMVDMQKEVAIIVAVNEKGETALYPPVEMVFNPQLNQLAYQLCPAGLDDLVLAKIEAISLTVVRNFKSAGIFAVELFVDRDGGVLVNETAPRVHNSGHHSIEAHFSSQFDMLWRVILNLPLGNTQAVLPSVMINVIGEEGYSGPAVYDGLNEVLKIEQAFVHLYGKKETKPGRKMGHITIMHKDKTELVYQYGRVKSLLKVISE